MGVLYTSKEIENLKYPRTSKIQNSNLPKIPKKKQKKKTTILHRPWGEEGVRQSPGTIVLFLFLFN